MYPEYLESLEERTGLQVALDRSGVLEVALDESDATTLRTTVGPGTEWLDASAVHALEPSLAPAAGAAFHPHDGAVDSTALLSVVRVNAERDRRVRIEDGRVVRIDAGQKLITVELQSTRRSDAPHVVVAAGAWVSAIAGLPRGLPVAPARGQILSFSGAPVSHVVMGPRGYVVPRGSRSLIGGTTERVGFDAQTTEEGARLLRQVARELVPAFADQAELSHWAGLRPMTPDLLPIVGADPEYQGLIYACGHSKNGVLLAPLTARVIADLIVRGSTPIDVAPYAPGRFAA
jgi:glycine oxidase